LPINLIFVYPQWNVEAGDLLWWAPLAAALLVTAVLWWYGNNRRIRPLFFAWGFFCVALAPVMGFVGVGYMLVSLVADHYQHIAIAAPISLAAAGWSIWHRRAPGKSQRAAIVVAVAAVGVLALLTWRQSGIYHNAIILNKDTLDKNPKCWMACCYLGLALADADRPREAIANYEQALRLKPDYYEAQNYMGKALFQTGRAREAIDHFKRSIEIKSDYINAYNNLALAYAAMNQSAEAISAARKALDIARSKGRTALAKQIQDWLNSYERRE
jgi:protein O-mannosyl-transferase